ncbi:MAG: CoA transferase [Actinomycetota bacterium]|nr:CoA transferase [Actinomycetota bacterium]
MADDLDFLAGIRVLDFTQYLAGPACTRLMAELGAEVIKIEAAPAGDPTRQREPAVNGRAGLFVQQHRGKRSLAIDLRRPEGVAAVKELVRHADVVVENSTPGVMARKGLGYDDLSKVNPAIIMASVSGFGQYGPYTDRKCFDFIAQAMTGMMHMTGEPDGPPYFVGVGLADTNAGVHAFAGIGYALFRRDRTGKGAHIDVAMTDAMFHMHEFAVQASSITGDRSLPLRQGRHYQPASPAGTFRSPGGWIVILCTDQQMPFLWKAMHRLELADDERFATNESRLENRDELTILIEDWMSSFSDDQAVLEELAAAGVPAGPVMSPADAVDDPHFRARGTVREIHDPKIGTFHAPGFPLRFDGQPVAPELVAPSLGEHNGQVLGELLGWTQTELEAAEASGLLVTADN